MKPRKNSPEKTRQEKIDFLKSLMLDFTTFGVGRGAYKNDVSHKERNIGDPYGFDLPGPGDYDPVSSFDLKPIGGGNCLTPRIISSDSRNVHSKEHRT